MARSKNPKVQEWRNKALRLYLAGCSFAQVAQALDMKRDTVRQGIEAELSAETGSYVEDIRRDRAVKCAQLDTILRGNLQKASSGDINASFVCIAVIKEQVRIKGLASADKLDITGKLSVSFDATAELMRRLKKMADAKAPKDG